jgi:hypothetical protein
MNREKLKKQKQNTMDDYFGKNIQGNHGDGNTDEGLQVRVETNNTSGAAFLE